MTKLLSDSELYRKAMGLEFKLQEYMQRDSYIGKGGKNNPPSRAHVLFLELGRIWREIHRRGRLKGAFGDTAVSPRENSNVNPYGG